MIIPITISKVHKYKMLCIITFITISIMIIFLVSLNTNKGKIVLNSVVSNRYANSIEVFNPILYGIDSKNRPYNVVAKKAKQVDQNVVELTDLSAEFVDQNNRWFAATADSGILENSKELLDLNGEVHIFTTNSSDIKSKDVTINFNQGSASSTNNVEMVSASGILLANGFKAENQGKNIKFTGPIKMKIYPYSKQ